MKLAFRLARLRYELLVLGVWLFAVPLVVAGGLGGLAGILDARNVNRGFLAQLLTATMEACLPLALGVLVATVTARDAALELQLSAPTPYQRTSLGRISLLLAWTALIEAATMLIIQLTLPWAVPTSGGAADVLLLWLAPMLWLAAGGALFALVLRSSATAGAVLGAIWIAQLALHSYFATNGWTQPWFLFATLFTPQASFWEANRVELILTAIVAFAAVWWYLRNAEWRFRAEEG